MDTDEEARVEAVRDWARDAALRLGRRVGRSRLIEIADLAGVIDYAAVSQATRRFDGERIKTAPALGTIRESIVECLDLTQIRPP